MKNRCLLLDLDGTLIERNYSRITPTPWLEQILAIGKPMAICSNQGGIAWNLAGGRPGKSYPNWPEVVERIAAGMELIGVKFAFVALYHPGANIPSGTILRGRGQTIGLPPGLIEAIANGDTSPVVIPIGTGYIVASWSPLWRKPEAMMLRVALRMLDRDRQMDWCYVGDEPDDRTAAFGAGIGFIDVRELQQYHSPAAVE